MIIEFFLWITQFFIVHVINLIFVWSSETRELLVLWIHIYFFQCLRCHFLWLTICFMWGIRNNLKFIHSHKFHWILIFPYIDISKFSKQLRNHAFFYHYLYWFSNDFKMLVLINTVNRVFTFLKPTFDKELFTYLTSVLWILQQFYLEFLFSRTFVQILVFSPMNQLYCWGIRVSST